MAAAAAPLVSFVVAAYNAERTLQRTLGSLATDVDPQRCEVLVIDDGSTDGTARIAEGFCRLNPQFRLLRQENRGLGAVRNRGVEEARGDYLAFCDADDVFLPVNHLAFAERLQAQQADLGIGLAFCLTDNASVCDFWDHAVVRLLARPEAAPLRPALKFLTQPSACNKLFRREHVLAHGIRFTPGRLFEDVEFTTGALLHTGRVAFEALHLFIYDVRRPGSITGSRSPRRMEILDNLVPLIARANRCALDGAQSVCLLVALLRTVLWCLDNLPDELVPDFGLRLLTTVAQCRLVLRPADAEALDPLITDPWDRRALGLVKALWGAASQPRASTRGRSAGRFAS
ncbi:glycosyltransferase family A protein [Piscinibacter sakaiensis]|uniref:glycosyltransferase family 2 protein n=1 Tax=Piscinibacter sakaiensis TaxID=1547922 RepID=UPI003728AA89